MKIARFSTDGTPRYGIVDDDELVVLSGDPMYHGYDTTGERVPLKDAKILAPVIPRSKVVCVGMNYAAHAKEMGHDALPNPLIFLKPNTAVVGPGDGQAEGERQHPWWPTSEQFVDFVAASGTAAEVGSAVARLRQTAALTYSARESAREMRPTVA